MPNARTANDNNSDRKRFFKIPYVGKFSGIAQRRINKLVKRYCTGITVNLAFSSLKLKNMFSTKDFTPNGLRSNIVYKFVCTECHSVYISETSRHLSVRMREHLGKYQTSHVCQHLQGSESCFRQCSPASFTVLDTARNKQELRIKEAHYINLLRPNLNKQLKHYALTLNI